MEPVSFVVDGETLVGELHRARKRKAKGALVMLHGFNSCLKEFGDAPAELAQAGYHVLAYDARGYGGSEGRRGYSDVERAVADLDAAAGLLKGLFGDDLRLGVVGHSLGGAFAVATMGRLDHFAAGVAAHPVDRLWDELNPIEKAGYTVLAKWGAWMERRGQDAKTIPYKLGYDNLFVSREAKAWGKAVGFLSGTMDLGNYQPARDMQASAWAKEVTQPVMVVASDQDKVVRKAHSLAVYDALAGPKRLTTHRGGHSCWGDLDGEHVVAATAAWFDEHLGA
ncbi:MAG: alpha/beta hydrolase [Thermoplasmatota archaeon]